MNVFIDLLKPGASVSENLMEDIYLRLKLIYCYIYIYFIINK